MIGFERIEAPDRISFLHNRLVYGYDHSYAYPSCLGTVRKNKTVSVTLVQPSRTTKTYIHVLLA